MRIAWPIFKCEKNLKSKQTKQKVMHDHAYLVNNIFRQITWVYSWSCRLTTRILEKLIPAESQIFPGIPVIPGSCRDEPGFYFVRIQSWRDSTSIFNISRRNGDIPVGFGVPTGIPP
jgi:hypothetical protein